MDVVQKQWSCVVEGTLSFQIQSILNALKRLLKAEFHNRFVKASMDAAEIELHRAQVVLHDHPGNITHPNFLPSFTIKFGCYRKSLICFS